MGIPARVWVVMLTLLLPLRGIAADAYDTESELQSRWGYLVIDALVRRPVTNWQLNKDFTIDKLPLGRSVMLIRLKSGRYQWDEINVPYFDLPHRLDLADDRRWAFTIHARKINYAGTVVVGEIRSSDSVNVKMLNRTSEVVSLLREAYPAQMNTYELIYSGSSRDDFLDLMLERSTDVPAE